MNYFRTAKFSMEKYFQVEQFQAEYYKELIKNPLVAVNVVCGQINNDLLQCIETKGDADVECQGLQIQALACAGSIFVPLYFENFKTCLEANEQKENPLQECEKQWFDMVEKGSSAHDNMMRESIRTRSGLASVAERCEKECGFPSAASEGDELRAIECVAPILCPDQLTTFLQCVDKNGKDYNAAPCRNAGLSFARCFGTSIGQLALQEAADN